MAMVTTPRVVITGAAGVVGGVLMSGLAERYDVRGVDARRSRVPVSGRPVQRGQLRGARAVARSLRGAEVVVHLAELASQRTPWRDVHRTNLRVMWNVLDAARVAGARRVILASSNAVVGGYEDDHPYCDIVAGSYADLDPLTLPRLGVSVPVRPNGPYAVGKATSEAAGRYAADQHGLSVIALRIGTVLRSDRPECARHFSTLLTHRDLVHLVERCVDAPDELRFAIFYGVSANTWRFWDIEDARETIGYYPQDDAERWR